MIENVCAVFVHDNEMLITIEGQWIYKGMSGFPGGSIDDLPEDLRDLDTSALEEVYREVEEELGDDIRYLLPIFYIDIHPTRFYVFDLPYKDILSFEEVYEGNELSHAYWKPINYELPPNPRPGMARAYGTLVRYLM